MPSPPPDEMVVVGAGVSGAVADHSALGAPSAEHERRELLRDCLSRVGCSLRVDSRMSANYIRNGRGDPMDIAQVMCEMNFLHAKTNYRSTLNRMLHEERERGAWFDSPETTEAAKVVALVDWFGRQQSTGSAESEALPAAMAWRWPLIEELTFLLERTRYATEYTLLLILNPQLRVKYVEQMARARALYGWCQVRTRAAALAELPVGMYWSLPAFVEDARGVVRMSEGTSGCN
jgi:hypothetical protein